MLCGGNTLVNDDGWNAVALRLRCRSWTCRECAPIRRRQVMRQAADGEPNRFLTLTVNPHAFGSAIERAQKLAWAWRVVVKRIKKRLGIGDVQYFAVFEKTKRGEPHLHILLRSPYVSQKWLSNQMRELISAPVVDIRKVKNRAHAVWYVSKYIGKDLVRFGTLKRYWRTQGYLKSIELKDGPFWGLNGWKRDDRPLWKVYEDWFWGQKRWVFFFGPDVIFCGEKPIAFDAMRPRAPPAAMS